MENSLIRWYHGLKLGPKTEEINRRMKQSQIQGWTKTLGRGYFSRMPKISSRALRDASNSERRSQQRSQRSSGSGGDSHIGRWLALTCATCAPDMKSSQDGCRGK